jgi:hypothetical protein
MADPVSMAMIGAALGGGVSAARGGNPIKGALLGAVGGGIGGAAAASAGASAAAAGAAQTAGIAANPALSMGAMNTAAGATMAKPTLMATLQQVPKSFMQFGQENPVPMNLAADFAQEELRPKPPVNAGLLRGTPRQSAPSMEYQSSVPQISLI